MVLILKKNLTVIFKAIYNNISFAEIKTKSALRSRSTDRSPDSV